MNIIIKQKVSFERIASVLCGAVDPGYEAIRLWGEVRSKKDPVAWTFDERPVYATLEEAKKNKNVHYRHYYPLNEGGSLTIRDNEDGGKQYKLDMKAVKRGLELMAQRYPKYFTEILSGNDDGNTSDALVQLALFGDLIYG